ncbi:MAG TPA: ester cyclase [Nannocystaceae bacterium]|nr:ester cyclase [Nannocystaceae bacterium]
MRRFPGLSASVLGLLVVFAACDDAKPDTKGKHAKADARGKPTKSGRKYDAKPDAKADAKADAKTDAKTDAKADAKADAKVDAADEFAASRDETPVEVTAKPGTPEWFVQGLAAFRSGNIDPIVANFAPDIVWDAVGSPLEPPSKGKAAVQSRWEDLLTAIPDMKLHASRIFHQDDLVVLQVVLTGTHKGDFRGMPATNKPLGAEVIAWVWHGKDGKAKKVRVVYNEAALLAQMGKLEGAEVPPIPAIPDGEPEIITGDSDAAATKVMKQMYAAGKNSWKLCQEKLCVADVVHHETGEGKTLKTTAEHEAGSAMFFTAFPDLRAKPQDVISFGPDWVVTFMHAKGTHKGDMGPIKATKKKVNLAYSEVARLDGGKIAETWGYTNSLDMMAQLGLFTAPPKPEKAGDAAAPRDEGKAAADDAKADAKDDAKADAK